ncbi:MAG: hypothetical protein JW754_05770 [Candidatus Aenigmarchaeota archaeon]|nr:hypothetical protein [Candidatus Aenigmarchaeota archaeon]
MSEMADLFAEGEEVKEDVLTLEEEEDSGKEFFSLKNIPTINLFLSMYQDSDENDKYKMEMEEGQYRRVVVTSGVDGGADKKTGDEDPFNERMDFEYDNSEFMYRLLLSMNRSNIKLVESPVTSVSYGLTGRSGI